MRRTCPSRTASSLSAWQLFGCEPHKGPATSGRMVELSPLAPAAARARALRYQLGRARSPSTLLLCRRRQPRRRDRPSAPIRAAAAAARVGSRSFTRMFATWRCTACGLITRRSAMCTHQRHVLRSQSGHTAPPCDHRPGPRQIDGKARYTNLGRDSTPTRQVRQSPVRCPPPRRRSVARPAFVQSRWSVASANNRCSPPSAPASFHKLVARPEVSNRCYAAPTSPEASRETPVRLRR